MTVQVHPWRDIGGLGADFAEVAILLKDHHGVFSLELEEQERRPCGPALADNERDVLKEEPPDGDVLEVAVHAERAAAAQMRVPLFPLVHVTQGEVHLRALWHRDPRVVVGAVLPVDELEQTTVALGGERHRTLVSAEHETADDEVAGEVVRERAAGRKVRQIPHAPRRAADRVGDAIGVRPVRHIAPVEVAAGAGPDVGGGCRRKHTTNSHHRQKAKQMLQRFHRANPP